MNPAFDQILQFAAVKTDLDFNELERYQYRLKLREDVVPSPGALIVNRLNINDIIKWGVLYQAIRVGNIQNTNSLHIEYLRTSFNTYSILLLDLLDKTSNGHRSPCTRAQWSGFWNERSQLYRCHLCHPYKQFPRICTLILCNTISHSENIKSSCSRLLNSALFD